MRTEDQLKKKKKKKKKKTTSVEIDTYLESISVHVL